VQSSVFHIERDKKQLQKGETYTYLGTEKCEGILQQMEERLKKELRMILKIDIIIRDNKSQHVC
jgi:hypothetical protein